MSSIASVSMRPVERATPPCPVAGAIRATTRGAADTSYASTVAGIPAPLPTTISTLLSGTSALTSRPLANVPRSATATLAPPVNVRPNGVKVLKGVFCTGSAAATERNTLTVPAPRDIAATMSSRPLPSTSPLATSTPLV